MSSLTVSDINNVDKKLISLLLCSLLKEWVSWRLAGGQEGE